MSRRSRALRRLGVASFALLIAFIASSYLSRSGFGYAYSAGLLTFGCAVPGMAGAALFVLAGRAENDETETPDDSNESPGTP